jgi:hypothetical protein
MPDPRALSIESSIKAADARSHRRNDLIVAVTAGICLAVCVCFVSANLNSRFQHRQEAAENQLRILQGLPPQFDGVEQDRPQFQSRVLFPLLLAGAARLGVLSVRQWFLLLRLATAIAAFSAFLLLCIRGEGLPLKTAVAGSGALAYGLIFTFNHGWEHPTDFLDVLLFTGFIWLALRRRRLAFFALALVGTLNHQTSAFAAIVWFCLWGIDQRPRINWRETGYAAALGAASYSLSTVVKVWLGQDKTAGYVIDGWRTIPQFFDALRHPEPFMWPMLLLAMALPVSVWLFANRIVVSGHIRRLAYAALLIVVVSSPIAFWSELRSVFLAPLVVMTFAAVAAEGRLQRKLEHPSALAADARSGGSLDARTVA